MRLFPPPTDPVAEFERMLKEGLGLRLLQDKLGEHATPQDALRAHRRLRQQGRRPSRCLDDSL